MSPNELFARYLPVAKQIAGGFMRKLPKSVLRDDVDAAAMLGLWDAVTKDTRRDGFEWYVRVRIRGAIIDELRTQDWLPRRARLRTPHLYVGSLETVDNIDGVAALATHDTAELQLERKQCSQELRRRLVQLPTRERAIVEQALDGKPHWQIADEMGISEPRISQLRSRAIERILGHRPMKHRSQKRPEEAIEPKRDYVWDALMRGSWVCASVRAFRIELTRSDRRQPIPARDAAVVKHWLLTGAPKETAHQFSLSRASIAGIVSVTLKAIGFPGLPNSVPAVLAMTARAQDCGSELLHLDRSGESAVAFVTPNTDWLVTLSVAESVAVNALLNGETRETLSSRRGTSSRTVSNQLRSAFQKLRVSTIAELRTRCARVHVTPRSSSERAA